MPLRAIPSCHMLGSEEAVWELLAAPPDEEPSTSSAPSEPRYGEAEGPRGDRPRKSRLYWGDTGGRLGGGSGRGWWCIQGSKANSGRNGHRDAC